MCVVGYTKKVDMKKARKNDGNGAAWSAGDSVLVVGSSRADGNDDGSQKGFNGNTHLKRFVSSKSTSVSFNFFNIIQKRE
jgi:hypothetical protein